MRIPLRVVLSLSVLCLVAAQRGLAQAPTPAPREPVRKEAPVVAPQGTLHPQKPGADPKPADARTAAKPSDKAPDGKAPDGKATGVDRATSGKTATKSGDHKAADGKKPDHKAGEAKAGKAAAKPAAQPAPAPPAAAEAPQPANQAEKLPDPEKPENGPAKLPRFASLRADEVNMRAGPGSRYRIEWVYKRRELPVEIEREYDVWRYVRDPDGIQGWMQHATLMGRRSFIVQHNDATMRAEPNDNAAAVAVLKPGVIGRIRSCDAASDWCNVSAGSYRGWLRRDQFWGTLPHEAITP